MKAKSSWLTALCFFLCLSLAMPAGSLAQKTDATGPETSFSREQLTQMLAPIALYPDAILSQVLMASTYPIEVIEAARWIRDHEDLKGANLDQALQEKDWDPSVKSLCHSPNLLTMMSNKIAETTNLGNAFLAQEDEVMGVIQELRGKAFEEGNLRSNQKEKVIVENQTIIIKPVNPEVIYVPYYDPFYVYGPWWYPNYPPFYWGPPNLILGAGLYYWPTPYFGFAIGTWSYFDWPQHYIIVDAGRRPRFFRHDEWHERRGRWHHMPKHRRGVAYRDIPTARRFGQAPHQRHFGRNIRGFPGPDHVSPHIPAAPQQNFTRPAVNGNGRESEGTRPSRPRFSTPEKRQLRESSEPQRQFRERTEQHRKSVRQFPAPPRQATPRIEPQNQGRERAEQHREPARRFSPPTRQTPLRIEPQSRVRERAEQHREPARQFSAPPRQFRQGIEPRRPAVRQERDNAFSRIEEGREEHHFSSRGRASRHSGHRNGDSSRQGRRR